jgi:hypothetical protein
MAREPAQKRAHTFPHDNVSGGPDHPYDILSMRLDQCAALLVAMQDLYDDPEDSFILPPSYMYHCLIAIGKLLDDARHAARNVNTEACYKASKPAEGQKPCH